jgi:tripartite-type tricarboxylate transporter receptor subunit TctC
MTGAARLMAILCFALAGAAPAADFPGKHVTLVVPFPAGGVVDIVGRLLAERLGASFGTRVIVENRTGAGGTIGAGSVARAERDGNTLLMGGAATQVFGPVMYPKVGYDPQKSFAPISQISAGPLVLVVGSSVTARSFDEFLAWLKASGARVNYASNGPGTFPHLSVELLKQAAGVNPTHVAYGGGPKALIALLANEASFSINHIPVVMPQIKAGRLRALATTGAKRSSLFPELPTLAEGGIRGFEASAWWGLFAPAGTPKPVIDRIHAASAEAVASRELQDKFRELGDEPVGGTPEALAAYLQAELAKWPKVIRDSGVKVE